MPNQRDENKHPVQLWIDRKELERIDKAAKRAGVSRSQWLMDAARERLERGQ